MAQGMEMWARLWGGGGREPVVFGHAAGMKLQLCPRACGVDTGCVKGAFLSALVLEPAEPDLLAETAGALDAERRGDGPVMRPKRGLPCTLVAVEALPPAPAPPNPSLDTPRTAPRGCPDLVRLWTLDDLQAVLPRVTVTGGAAEEQEGDNATGEAAAAAAGGGAGAGGAAAAFGAADDAVVAEGWRLMSIERAVVPVSVSTEHLSGSLEPEALSWKTVWPAEEAAAADVVAELDGAGWRESVQALRARLEWRVAELPKP